MRREAPPWVAGTDARHEELYPKLSDEEVQIFANGGEAQTFKAGDWLWRVGDQNVDFYVVLHGEMEIVGLRADREHVIVRHGPGSYSGEIASMSGGGALVGGRASTDLRVIAVKRERTRQVIANEPELGEKVLLSFILRRMRLTAEALGDVQLVGNEEDPHTATLAAFLMRNGVPFEMIDTRSEPERSQKILRDRGLPESDRPVIATRGETLVSPSRLEAAELIGFTTHIDSIAEVDVAVIGAGPAGLAAAVHAASEGLVVAVIESWAPGGQAGSSSKIENYLGFPTGISGQALAGRAFIQAQKFGARVAVARQVLSFQPGVPRHELRLDRGDTLYARSVVVATGAVYRSPTIERLDGLRRVHYGASHFEGQLCRGRDVAVVGGGNSAGQAAVYLSRRARSVHIIVRGSGLSHSMSSYLIQRLDQIPNVTLHPDTIVEAALGDEAVAGVRIRHQPSGRTSELAASHLFIFVGAQPGTDFLKGSVALDEKGYVVTGDQLDADARQRFGWPLERDPYPLETSCPGVFAAGDVRAGSIKRVAAAAGEGTACIASIHRILEH